MIPEFMLHKIKKILRATAKPFIKAYNYIIEYLYLAIIIQRIQYILNENIHSINKESLGLNNLVYSFTTSSGKYIYKEFMQINKDEERMAHAIFNKTIIYEENCVRIEKYIKSRNPKYLEDMKKIVFSINKIHQMKINVKMFSELILQIFSNEIIYYKKNNKIILLNLFKKIIEKYKKYSNYLVICHNDLQPGNILITNEEAILIDFEYVAFAPPHYEFANLFCEMSYDIKLGFMDKSKLPNEIEKLKILKEYFNNPKEALIKVNSLMCVSHFFWYLWARMCHRKGKDVLRYDEYARKRLEFLKDEEYLNVYEYNELLLDLKEL